MYSLASVSYCCLQYGHDARTSRWAMMPITEDDARNGSTPMSISRVTAPGASLVCSVLRHQVAGQRGLDGDLGRLAVADLADQDDVGVLAQDRAQAGGERQPDLCVDLDLVDALRAGTRPGPRR